jgi:hypothetical protein
MKGRAIKYSDEELQWVSDNRTMEISKLHSEFCVRFDRSDVSAIHLSSLRKRKRWFTGRSGCFKKGGVPFNAGTKGLMKANKTSFKKGDKPANWRPVGSTRLSKDGYMEIKIEEPRAWKLLHIVIWEERNREVPVGYCVSFKDLDKATIEINHLELISRNENLQINRLHPLDHDESLIETIRLTGKVKAKTIGIAQQRTIARHGNEDG